MRLPCIRLASEHAGQVLIRAGVPGKPDLKVDHGKPYPNTTTDMAKLIAERGLTVAFEDGRDERCYVSFYAAELWIPILQVHRRGIGRSRRESPEQPYP